jgi:hypothetical protein
MSANRSVNRGLGKSLLFGPRRRAARKQPRDLAGSCHPKTPCSLLRCAARRGIVTAGHERNVYHVLELGPYEHLAGERLVRPLDEVEARQIMNGCRGSQL